MEKFLVILGAGLVLGLLQVFVTNPLAQKVLPTDEGAGFGRRFAYIAVHRIILAVIVIGVGLLAVEIF